MRDKSKSLGNNKVNKNILIDGRVVSKIGNIIYESMCELKFS